MSQYWRVTFKAANDKRRHVWAKNYNDPGAGGVIRFEIVDKYADETEPRELVFVHPKDLISLHAARLSNTYAELEKVQA